MADEKSDSDAKDGGTSCFLNNFQTTADSIEVLITNVVRNFQARLLKSGRKLIALSLMY